MPDRRLYTARITESPTPESQAVASSGIARYRLLGRLSAYRVATPGEGATAASAAEQPIELGSPKQRAVLAYLLLHRGRVVTTDRLVDAVWPIEPPPSATSSLQAYISNLRRALRDSAGGASPIAWNSSGYVFDVAADHVDLPAFRTAATDARAAADAERWADALTAADEALALWRGPLLEDLADEPWVRGEAAAAEEILADVRETRITALLAEGRVADAILAAQEVVAEGPLRDRGCWLLMVALYRAGRTPEALDRFREHAARMDAELGLEPGTELRELQVSILRQEPALAAWPRTPGWQGAPEVVTPAATTPTPTPAAAALPADDPTFELSGRALFGRDRETAILERVAADVADGSVRWLVLSGPAGIGKTRLADHYSGIIRARGGQDVWARCPEEEGSPAWWPIRQVIVALGEDPGEILARPDGVDADEARFAIYDRVAEVLEAKARELGGLTVIIDDVQWADRTSARCLAFLAGRLYQSPVAMVLTLREGEDDAAIRPLLSALARSAGHVPIGVGPLDPEAVRDLADRIATEPLEGRELDVLVVRTGGNPLFVQEYARLAPSERGGDGIPLAVRSVLGKRLEGLEPGVVHVLRAAAVIGDVVDIDLVSATIKLDFDEVADLLDEAADEHIVVPAAGTGGYAFAHGLLREEVLAQIPTMRRQRLHLRVAEVLEQAGAEPSRRAQHLVMALPLADAAETVAACRAAALDAIGRTSSDTAADWWLEALRAYDLLPASERTVEERDDLLLAQVDALVLAARRQSVLDVIDTGMFNAVREGRTRAVGRLAQSLLRVTGAWPWVSSANDPGAMQARLADVEPLVASDPAAHARVLAALGVGSAYEMDRTIPHRHTMKALEIAERLGDPEVLADAILARFLTYSGIATHASECEEFLGRLESLPHERSQVDHAVGHGIASMAAMNLGNVEEAAEHVRLGIVGADMLRLPAVRVQLRWAQGMLAQWRGEFGEADRHYSMAGDVHQQTELHSAAAGDVPAQTLLWDRGLIAELDDPGLVETETWEASIAYARGDAATAREILNRWVVQPRAMVWNTLGHTVLMAHLAVDLQATDAARRLADYLAPFDHAVAIIGHVGLIGTVGIALARLRGLLGDLDGAREALDISNDIARRGGGAPALVRGRLAAIEFGLTPAESHELEAIAAAADRIGMLGIAADARRRLAAA
ncbi:MAG: BTAD domain-containing putative transcriptional regulator [Patulibacter sp.]|nr:BTAD domain-containing putative transcriptional regulator [Patulibacter sp.]